MAATITLKVTSKKEEKSWMSDPKGKPQNRHTITLDVEYISDPEDPDYKSSKEYDGSSFNLSTLNEKKGKSFKIGDEYTLSLKKK